MENVKKHEDLNCNVDEHSHAHEHYHSHEHSHSHDHGEEAEGSLKRLIIGIIAFVIAVILSNVLALPWWGELILYGIAYVILGFNVLKNACKNISRGEIFDENFLMTVATIGAFILGEYFEGAAVMLFYLIGETLSDFAVEKSKKSITKLMDIRPDYANIEKDGKLIKVSPEKIAVGDIIIVEPGEKIPLDGVVEKGNSTANTAALTGESVPRDLEKGSEVLAGFVNGEGEISVKVTKPFAESTASKILDIVENASSKKAETEKFITKFAHYYTPAVCAGAVAVAVIPSLVTGDWATWIQRALIFLVISCPCALVVSVPLSYFSGIGGASKNGILIKGAIYIDIMDKLKAVVFDKTGTLTQGKFEVEKIISADGFSYNQVLEYAAIAETGSSHPIAKSILNAYGKEIQRQRIEDYKALTGLGVSARYENKNIIAGKAKLLEERGIKFEQTDAPGTVLYVAVDNKFAGSIIIADLLKPDAKQTVSELNKMDIKTAMLTGDNKKIADAFAKELDLKAVYSDLLPQDKVTILEDIERKDGLTAFVGDGVNDAPVLACADVGFAMGALGSDAAIEAADVVLMTDEPKKVPLGIKISHKTKRIVWQNIIFALAVKACVMILGIEGIAGMNAAVFADVGVTLIAVLNSLRALKAPQN